MKKVLAPSLALAGLLVAGSAAAEGIYDSWIKQSDVDISKSVEVSKSLDITKTQDNDYTSIYESHEDNDVTKSWRNSEDNDYISHWSNKEDNDYESHYTHTEDNDVVTDIDSQLAKSAISSYKFQDQDAGHQADTSVFGVAKGHDTSVQGGPTVVSAGNDDQRFYGPAMVNTNINQMPVNTAYVMGSNGGPIHQANTFAGRDLGPKGVFAPVGNTAATVVGDVGQTSAAQVGQSGDSANSIADPISTTISKP